MGMFGFGSIFQEIGNMIRHDKDIANGWITNAWNAKQAKKAWSRNLWASSTQHQREVEDLRKAGLNPILSALNGVGSQVAASVAPTSVLPQSHTSAPDFQGAFNSSKMLRLAQAKNNEELELIKAQKLAVQSSARKSDAEALESASRTSLNDSYREKIGAEILELDSRNQLNQANTALRESEARYRNEENQRLIQRFDFEQVGAELNNQLKLIDLSLKNFDLTAKEEYGFKVWLLKELKGVSLWQVPVAMAAFEREINRGKNTRDILSLTRSMGGIISRIKNLTKEKDGDFKKKVRDYE